MKKHSVARLAKSSTALARFARNEEGWVTVASLFWVLSALAIGAVAVDFTNLQFAETKLAATTDAAATAAVKDLPDAEAARLTALEYIEKNMPESEYGRLSNAFDIQTGSWNLELKTFQIDTETPNAVRVVARRTGEEGYARKVSPLLAGILGFEGWQVAKQSIAVGGGSVCVAEGSSYPLANLSDYLFYFDDASGDANWQGATKGFVGDVAVNGVVANERTSGGVPYDGNIYTNSGSLGGWQGIVDQNPQTSSVSYGEFARIDALSAEFQSVMGDLTALPATTGYTNLSSSDLDGLNTQNDVPETIVMNITSGLSVSTPLTVHGDADDLFILRWDSDLGAPGFQGQVKFSGGGGINPLGDLTPTNFINLAGDLNASGGGGGLHSPANTQSDMGCSVFAFEGGDAVINSSTRITGNLCYAGGVTSLTNQKAENFTGATLVHSNATFAYSDKDFLPSGGITTSGLDAALEVENQRLLDLSAQLLAFDANMVLPNPLSVSAYVRAHSSGMTVIELDSLNLNGATITLDGEGVYVFNFTGSAGTFDWSHAVVELRNGAEAGNVFWNFAGAYDIMINKDTNVFRGHILAPKGNVIYHNPADFDGSISALNVNLHSMFDLEGLPTQFDDPTQPKSGLAVHLAKLQNEVSGGGFFTGYWLTTGAPDKDYENASLSNGIFVGGWYSSATKFSMTSGTSGVYVEPPFQLMASGNAPCVLKQVDTISRLVQ